MKNKKEIKSKIAELEVEHKKILDELTEESAKDVHRNDLVIDIMCTQSRIDVLNWVLN